MSNKGGAWQLFFLAVLAMLVLEALTGLVNLKEPGLVESIVIILLWLAGQR